MSKLEAGRCVPLAASALRHTAGGWFAVWLLAAGAASAQVYPPPGYPGGYPPGTGPGNYPTGGPTIPIGRGKKTGDSTKGQPMPNFRGKLQQMDSKTITIALVDDRRIDFKRNEKTKFFKNGQEVKDPQFARGDQLSVEGPEDEKGYLIAVNVYWEKPAAASQASADSTSGAVDTWKDNGKDSGAGAKAAEPATPEPATEVIRTAAKPDADDPGPPKLSRGKPADAAREEAPDVPPEAAPQTGTAGTGTAGTVAPPPTEGVTTPIAAQPAETADASVPPPPTYHDSDETVVPESRPQSGDDLIRKAAAAAFDFTEGLPNYMCQEDITRYASDTRPADWRSLDLVSASVIYENGKEDYRNIKVNNKPRPSFADTDGAWSTGEFGTLLIDLFSPATDAQFRFRQVGRASGINVRIYDYTVDHPHSHWRLIVSSQQYQPAYKGSVWIDPQTARVLRIEQQAYGFPSDFPTDHVESATDYEYVQLGDARKYLLPVHSETLTCQRGSDMCNRNVIDFRNYHKYAGESTITFDDKK